MTSFNKIISDYIKVDDTAVKNAIIDLYVDSKSESLPHFVNDVLEKCGVNSINVMLVDGKKWDAYMSFTPENIFSEEKGILELIKTPNSKHHAEETLANKLIDLLDTVDFYTFIKRVK
ncbi:MAG: hypothetical protein COA88_09675 [Kordia sp.]|nr:MAG: hypothetical protein COA88_09675 [Kordia sp.]